MIKWEPSIPMLNIIQIVISEKKCTLLLASPEAGLRQSFLFFPQLLSFFFLFFNLKGHCHEDFAVLGQFCAKIITLKGTSTPIKESL